MQDLRTAGGRLAAEYQPLRQVLTHHRDYLSQVAGNDVAGYIDRVVAVSRSLDADPIGTLKQLIAVYRVDATQLYDPLETPPDPKVSALEQEVARLRAGLSRQEQDRTAADMAAVESQLSGVVDKFLKDNPDAQQIEAEIAAEINFLRSTQPNMPPAAMLSKAYERAAWSSDATRSKRIDALIAARLKSQQEAAAKAKSVSGVNVSGAPQAAPADGDDLDASLRNIWRKNNSR
jgi:hypothetical protein